MRKENEKDKRKNRRVVFLSFLQPCCFFILPNPVENISAIVIIISQDMKMVDFGFKK